MRFVANLSQNTWALADKTARAGVLEFGIGFINDEHPTTVFDGLSFGFDATCGEKATSVSEPAEGVEYVSTDQEIIGSWLLADAIGGEEWTIRFWAENAGVAFEDTFTVLVEETPAPTSPYPSWVWDEVEGMWVPPIPYPEGTDVYRWNEETQQWDKVVV